MNKHSWRFLLDLWRHCLINEDTESSSLPRWKSLLASGLFAQRARDVWRPAVSLQHTSSLKDDPGDSRKLQQAEITGNAGMWRHRWLRLLWYPTVRHCFCTNRIQNYLDTGHLILLLIALCRATVLLGRGRVYPFFFFVIVLCLFFCCFILCHQLSFLVLSFNWPLHQSLSYLSYSYSIIPITSSSNTLQLHWKQLKWKPRLVCWCLILRNESPTPRVTTDAGNKVLLLDNWDVLLAQPRLVLRGLDIDTMLLRGSQINTDVGMPGHRSVVWMPGNTTTP